MAPGDFKILATILADLGPTNRRAILECARRGYGEARNLRGVLAVARELGAKPRVVAAAFLFLPSMDNLTRFVDMSDNSDSAMETALLPDSRQMVAAFALGRAAYGGDSGDLAPFAYTPWPGAPGKAATG